MPPLLPRFDRTQQQRADERRLAAILLEAADEFPDGNGATPLRRSADGWNRRRARGIPIVGRVGGAGASPGTDPLGALLAKEARRRL